MSTHTLPAHLRILHTLENAGFSAYVVGGYVRDLLLGRESKDIDIVTSATPAQIVELFPEADRVGAHFGVILVKEGGETFDVATYRLDGAYSDHRHPDSVAYSKDVREDVFRRDFTINALLMDSGGEVHDYVAGREALRSRVIEAVGNPYDCFQADALRMLRAIRFACQLGFTIEERTSLAIKQAAPHIARVSVERVQQELTSILTSGKAALGIQLLVEHNLMEWIVPEFGALIGCEQNPKYHPEGDVYTHTLGLLEKLEPGGSITLALAALLHDIGKPDTLDWKDGQPTFHGHEKVGADMAVDILRRLKYPNEVIDVVTKHVAEHMRFRVTQEMRKSKLYRFLRQPHFNELLALHKLDAASGSGNMKNAEFVESVLHSVPPEKIHPPRLLTGKDLIEMGLKPGPQFATILEAVETEQLEGRIATRTGALAHAKAIVALSNTATP